MLRYDRTDGGHTSSSHRLGVALGAIGEGVLIDFVAVRVGTTRLVGDPARRVGATSSSSGVDVALFLGIAVTETARRIGIASSSSGVAVALPFGITTGERRGVGVAVAAPSTMPVRGYMRGSVGVGIGAYMRCVGVASIVAVADGTAVAVRVGVAVTEGSGVSVSVGSGVSISTSLTVVIFTGSA